MNTPFKFDWGEEVRVVVTAPSNMRPGQFASVCGMREMKGSRVYTVEFGDGQAMEIPEDSLEKAEDK